MCRPLQADFYSFILHSSWRVEVTVLLLETAEQLIHYQCLLRKKVIHSEQVARCVIIILGQPYTSKVWNLKVTETVKVHGSLLVNMRMTLASKPHNNNGWLVYVPVFYLYSFGYNPTISKMSLCSIFLHYYLILCSFLGLSILNMPSDVLGSLPWFMYYTINIYY